MSFDDADGATPIGDEELEGLIPGHIQTRTELNTWEHLNIESANDWLRRSRTMDVISIEFLRMLHQKMFENTWKWAGEFRTTNKNIGVPKERIWPELKDVCDDARHWIDNEIFSVREIAARFHHRVVSVHPFANGNGRHARLAADAFLLSKSEPRFSWAGQQLQDQSDVRRQYILSLREADRGDYQSLYEHLNIAT